MLNNLKLFTNKNILFKEINYLGFEFYLNYLA